MIQAEKTYDLIIIGSGAAGLAAGLYAGRYKMKVLIIGHEFGGETITAGKIENYPGISTIDGYQLMKNMREQVEALGIQIVSAEVTKISRVEHCFELTAGEETYQAPTVIFAQGAQRRRLGLPNEKELTGRGVHYCVTCDGPVYNGKTIAIVGGGDASVKGLNLAAEYVKKIFLIVRSKEITAESINFERMKKLGDKVEILFNTEVKEIVGRERLEKILLTQPYQGSAELKVDGLFVEIGALPNVALATALDERGYVKVDNLMKTNIDGVFAAGDTVNHFGSFKQDITAAAMGAVAATSAYNDRQIHGEVCLVHARPALSRQV